MTEKKPKPKKRGTYKTKAKTAKTKTAITAETLPEVDQDGDVLPSYAGTGRPLAIGLPELQKLEFAFSAGATIREACVYANVKERTYYHYCEKYPEFLHKMTEFSQMGVIRAKLTVYTNLKNVDTAKWFLEKKCPEEFGNSLKLSGKVETTVVTKDSLKDLISDIIELKKLSGVELTEEELIKSIEGQLSTNGDNIPK